MPDRFRGPLHEGLSQALGTLEPPVDPGLLAAACGDGRDAGVLWQGGGGRRPCALCPAGAEAPRSDDGTGPGEGLAERDSGMALGPLGEGGGASGDRLQGDTPWGHKGVSQEGMGRAAPRIRGQGEGGSAGLETACEDLWRADMMVPAPACEGGATGEWHRLQGGPTTQEGAKDRGGFVLQPWQHGWARVRARPGQALGPPDVVAHHAAAGCDALGACPQRGALRREGRPLVALGQPPCERECGLGRVVFGPAGGAGGARARPRQRIAGAEDEKGILAPGGAQRALVQCEADRHGWAVEPRAPRGDPRGNGLRRVRELQARPCGGARSLEAPILLRISPVDPKKSHKGVG
jgi:hypothetical protein